MTLDPTKLAGVRSAAEKATPGPWLHDEAGERQVVMYAEGIQPHVAEACTFFSLDRQRADAAFIALANPATVVALCDEIDTLTAALTECVKFLDHVEGQGYGGMAIYDVASIMARSALSTQTQGGGENG